MEGGLRWWCRRCVGSWVEGPEAPYLQTGERISKIIAVSGDVAKQEDNVVLGGFQ